MEIYQAIIIIAFLYIGYLSPILCSWYLVIAKGKGVKWRWLFPFVAPLAVYILVLLAILILFAPLHFSANYIVPSLREANYEVPIWVAIYELAIQYDGYIIAIVLIGMSVWITKYLWPHWQSRFGENA